MALNAYGWTGPWTARRGFDSLVQMSSGIAHAGMEWKTADAPVPLPVQALDFATGYLMAAAVLRALRLGRGGAARLSLARTSALLASVPPDNSGQPFAAVSESDLAPHTEATDWGPARRVRFPADMSMSWRTPARRLHADGAVWG